VISPGGSDSASLDNAVEFLLHSGRSLPHVMAMLIPEAWSGNPDMDEEKRAFYEYHASLMEPWDGPAAVAFTDGRIIGATLDRNGLRPGRYIVTKDDLVVLASEAGVIEVPAEDVVSKLGIKDADDPRLEDATAELYKAEFHRGTMKENCGEFSRMKVSEAKVAIVEQMKGNGFTFMYELPEKVVCKCGTRCYVKILENQWFLNYSDPAWKELTREVIRSANVYPPESLEWYYSTIDWLRNWPCARRAGMGTKLPWDKEWIVETLSDSTIYMAFYTINHQVNSEKVKYEQLTPEVFDYLFHGKGSPVHLAKASGIDMKLLTDMRNEFLYWYPVDLRNSAKELIPNHLTFFAFHHAALFEKSQWPRGKLR